MVRKPKHEYGRSNWVNVAFHKRITSNGIPARWTHTNTDVGNTANYSYVRTLYDQELPSYTENEVMRTLNLTLDPSLLDSAITGVNDYRIQFALTTGSTTAFYTVSDVTLTWAPEPGTYAMWLGIGFMGAICYGRRGHQCLSSGA